MFGNKKSIIIKLLVILFIVFNLLITINCMANAIDIPDPNQKMDVCIFNPRAKAQEYAILCELLNTIVLLTYIFTSLIVYKKVKEKNKKNEIILITVIYIFITLEAIHWFENIFVYKEVLLNPEEGFFIGEDLHISQYNIPGIFTLILMTIDTIFIIIKTINNFIKINKMKKEEKPKCQE